MNLPSMLGKYRSEVDAEIKAVVNSHPLPLYDMIRYHLGWIDSEGNPVQNNAGKALRPALCLFSCEAVGGNYRKALPAAAALELIHNFSLIHDDIQDDDKERRHRPTVWAIWGKPQAINAGTAMRILANTALARFQGDGVSLQKQLTVNQRLDEISLRLLEGQFLDIDYEKRFDIALNDYLTMIERKTSTLIAGSMEIGAYLGTDSESHVNSFYEIGKNLGTAFQIRDDILGIWGNQEKTGKPSGNDIRRRKKSFPVVYTLENVSGDLKSELINIYQNQSKNEDANNRANEDSVNRVLEIFALSGARSNAQMMIEAYCEKARQIYDQLNLLPPIKKDLEEIVQFLTDRNF